MDSEHERTTTEQPWMELAQWLRKMHSMAKSGVQPSPPKEEASSEKRRMYFACNRHYIGLVIR